MFKYVVGAILVLAYAYAAIKTQNGDVIENNQFIISSEFCAGTVPMGNGKNTEDDVMVVACIENELYSGTLDKGDEKSIITQVTKLGFSCRCNSTISRMPDNIVFDLRKRSD